MPSVTTKVLSLVAGATLAAAHGFVESIVINGKSYSGYLVNEFPYESPAPAVIGWATTATDLGYVAPDAYNTSDIICHRGSSNAALSAEVAPGDEINLIWTTWPSSHHGPVLDYLARCANDDCATVDKTALEFFKINAVGLTDDAAEPGTWGSDSLIASNNSWTTTIPADLAPGNYVLRHEIIALHSAEEVDGAQNYPQCINLIVTGDGATTYTGTKGEALYTETAPGIEVNIYQALSTYDMPGPTLVSGATTGNKASTADATAAGTAITYGAGAAATSAAATTTAAAATATTSSIVVAVSTATSTTAHSAAAAVATPTAKPKCNKRRHARDVSQAEAL